MTFYPKLGRKADQIKHAASLSSRKLCMFRRDALFGVTCRRRIQPVTGNEIVNGWSDLAQSVIIASYTRIQKTTVAICLVGTHVVPSMLSVGTGYGVCDLLACW